MAHFCVKFNEVDADFDLLFCDTNSSFNANVGEVTIVTGDPYEGEYEVTPKVHSEVVLHTKDKTMADDVTVHIVPQYETYNVSGGNTLIIGDDTL